ncbi:MAG: HDIG domain-containing protein [Trueperaceae bacterium]|nr:HDIG domain-containing protein [Trueperaceae bacterium]MCC6312175.1 HDIG domain-containing protein [Trueperaceae bacterium]MCO5172830.1 HDIG domain-containing protein [Trueperaceae bacterium]MCW5820237.1 HDIG domain-containing protein [Trueperaceae bacterium]
MARKPAIWFLNAARRALLAAAPSLADPDDAWARRRLAPAEYALFERLPPEERAHGVEVAKCLAKARPDDHELLAAALLHDVGKLGTPRGAVVRALTHVLPPSDAAPEPRLAGLAGARQARVHHADYGAELLRRAGSSARVVELVARHHAAAGPGRHAGRAPARGVAPGAGRAAGPDPDGRLASDLAALEECDART